MFVNKKPVSKNETGLINRSFYSFLKSKTQ